MKLLSIASGSSGNCYYVGNDNTHLLVDAGISCKRVEIALKDEGLKPVSYYTSDAADERSSVDLGGRRIIKKKKDTAHSCCW